ncbi:MAG TPA: glycosyltransferase [Anaerolineae bacterium]|nr:glycosyltransferase [Anaerolineae bacterium]
MASMQTLIPALYQSAVFLLIFYGLFVLASVILFLRYRHRHDWPAALPPEDWPTVTIQTPIFNERQVAERVIAAVAALDYPADRLHIQVLDDSTDSTAARVARLVARLRRERGLHIEHLHRKRRTGYKAGALAAGLQADASDFVAIFDADFAPEPDWLKRTVAALAAHPELAFVQTRWAHLNRTQNLITAAQALALDGHFVVEQQARSASGFMQNFNGSGGLWRRAAIDDAGGWQADTVTEDLDLAYRAQLKGWRGSYVNAIAAPAELPPVLTGFKRQQRRWAKGSIQTLRKLALPILRSDKGWARKLYALAHMGGYAFHLPLLALLILSLPLALLPDHRLPLPGIGVASMAFSIAPFMMFALAQWALDGRAGLKRLWALPLLAILFMGLSPAISLSVLAGLHASGGIFERTPKQGRGPRQAALPRTMALRDFLPEALAFAYALLTTTIMLITGDWALLPLPLLFLAGTGLTLGLELSEYRSVKRLHRRGRTSLLGVQ